MKSKRLIAKSVMVIVSAMLTLLSSCDYFQDIDRYYIGGDYEFQHGVESVTINHTLEICHVNFYDGRQRCFDTKKVAVDSTKGEISINNVILYF